MRKIFLFLVLILIGRGLDAQNNLYSEKTIVSMWNENLSDWVTILERNDKVTFTLTKDRSMLLMYCKGSGQHFKNFYKEDGKDMMLLVTDTTFYRIISSEIVKDINGNSKYIINTESGVQNKDYIFHYYRNGNILFCIFDDNNGRMVGNEFQIKSGFLK